MISGRRNPALPIEELPEGDQHNEALGRLRDVAEWLNSGGAFDLADLLDRVADDLAQIPADCACGPKT